MTSVHNLLRKKIISFVQGLRDVHSNLGWAVAVAADAVQMFR